MTESHCPTCYSEDITYRKKTDEWTCEDCGHRWSKQSVQSHHQMKIFLSYGHDEYTQDALKIQKDLQDHGYQVWFDQNQLKEGRNWEEYIELGLKDCDRVVLLMTPHSIRCKDPTDSKSTDGFCLNEIAKAREKYIPIIPIYLVDVKTGLPEIMRDVAFLDMRTVVPIIDHEDEYRSFF